MQSCKLPPHPPSPPAVGEDEEEARVKRKVVKGHQRSEVEDEFFNLSDMEQYLEEAEQLSELGTASPNVCLPQPDLVEPLHC